MAKYNAAMGGDAIHAGLRRDIAEANANIAALARRDDLPAEHRRRLRQEAINRIRVTVGDAVRAHREWADEIAETARTTLNAETLGSPAEETRRLRREMEFERLVTNANASGTPRNLARQYTETATNAYLDSDYDRAVLYARAAVALGATNASNVLASAQTQLDLADPVKARAIREQREAKMAEMEFERDALAGLSSALRVTADAATAVGDDPRTLLAESTRLSLAAKGVALAIANETGGEYVHPEGALADAPTGGIVYEAGKGPRSVRTVERDPETGNLVGVTRVTA